MPTYTKWSSNTLIPKVLEPNRIAQKVLTKPQNPFMAKSKAKGKSLPKPQRGPQVQHFYHHCGVQGHTRPNYYKLHALKKADSQRLRE